MTQYNTKSVNTNTLTGKPSNWDFTTARNSATSILLGRDDLNIQDITSIEQYRGDNLIGIYDNGIDLDLTSGILTITQRSIAAAVLEFLVWDTFVVYTNIVRDEVEVNNLVVSPTVKYITAGIDTTSTTDVIYIGKFVSEEDVWLIMRIDWDWITYANVSNNPSYVNYASARTARTGITYDLSVTF